MTGTGTPQTRRGNATGLVCALVGIAVAIAAVLVFDQLSVRGEIPFAVQTPLSYLVTWVPMGGAVGVFAAMRRRAARATLRVGIRWIDLLWGGAIGIGCRMVAIGTSYAVYGSAGLSGAASIGGAVDPWLVFGALIAPIVIAPVVEELFFRGLTLGSLYEEVGGDGRRDVRGDGRGDAGGAARRDGRGDVRGDGRRRVSAWVAVVGTTVLFTVVHLITIPTAAAAIATAVPLFVLGAALGATTLATGRIGAAVVAHMVFNAIAAVIAYPW